MAVGLRVGMYGQRSRSNNIVHYSATTHYFGASLPFPFEDDEEPEQQQHVVNNSFEDCAAKLTPLLERLTAYVTPSDAFAAELLDDSRALSRLIAKGDRPVDIVVLATRLAAVGYRVVVRTAIGGGEACFKNLHHEYLVVFDCSHSEPVEYIVEPCFKEHFRISHPTPLYSALQEHLPADFVGTGEQLTPLVQLLCSEMASSFKQQSRTLPPWRQASSVLSKWLPARSRDSLAAGSPTAPRRPAPIPDSPPTPAGGARSTTGTTCKPRSMLTGNVTSQPPTKAQQVNLLVKPSPFHGQPPLYRVKIGL